jgi:hypothetical protein
MAVKHLAHMLVVGVPLSRKGPSVTKSLAAVRIVGDMIRLNNRPDDRCEKCHVLPVCTFVGPLLNAPTNILRRKEEMRRKRGGFEDARTYTQNSKGVKHSLLVDSTTTMHASVLLAIL